MAAFIYQLRNWPDFSWKEETLLVLLAKIRYAQGRLLGKMGELGFVLQQEANLRTLTIDVIKSSEIEGEILNPDQVRSSVARHLHLDIAGLIPSDWNIDGMVEMMIDATRHYAEPLNKQRLFAWHAALFPTGRSGMHKIVVGDYRDNPNEDPMQVVSGASGKEKVHFQAPDADRIKKEMKIFFQWFNEEEKNDPILKAGIAHLWFITIHPFDDGNGRIARAITDLLLARADQHANRFYSMSAQIRIERNAYYQMLEKTQKNTLDITLWLEWFLLCLGRAIANTDHLLSGIIYKARFWDFFSPVSINERQKIMLNKLLDGFDGKLTSSQWARITKTSQDTAGRDIQDLIGKGMLMKDSGGGRSTGYLLHPIKFNAG